MKRTTDAVAQLSQVSQETDLTRLQEIADVLGICNITSDAGTKKIKKFLRNVRVSASLYGKRVEDLAAEQVDIARRFRGVFGRRMSIEEINIVQQAGLRP